MSKSVIGSLPRKHAESQHLCHVPPRISGEGRAPYCFDWMCQAFGESSHFGIRRRCPCETALVLDQEALMSRRETGGWIDQGWLTCVWFTFNLQHTLTLKTITDLRCCIADLEVSVGAGLCVVWGPETARKSGRHGTVSSTLRRACVVRAPIVWQSNSNLGRGGSGEGWWACVWLTLNLQHTLTLNPHRPAISYC